LSLRDGRVLAARSAGISALSVVRRRACELHLLRRDLTGSTDRR
jgi:hypothetical protein